MKKFNKKSVQGEWINFPDDKEVKFKIRPFTLFNITKLPSEDNFDIGQVWNIFNYSVVGWKGIEDESGPMECNEENKKLVYDFDQDLVIFVSEQASSLREKVISRKEIKNSQTSQPGVTKKKDK